MMVAEGMHRRGVAVNHVMADNKRGRRWTPQYQRQGYHENRQYPVRFSRNTRQNLSHNNGVPVSTIPPSIPRQGIHIPACEVPRLKMPPRVLETPKDPIKPTQPQFQVLYQEFENMKKRGLVLNADMDSAQLPPPQQNKVAEVTSNNIKPCSVTDNFADAMKIFMKSYYPTSLACAKPVDDWSKEAGNLLQELTDKESHSDHDTSIWNIPGEEAVESSKSATSVNSPWSNSSNKVAQKLTNNSGFDIYRHIMEINPSPYPGGSPVSTGQSSSNHSSDNDADDEGTQSSNESNCMKAIGTKKSSKKRLHSSFTCSTMDSGYLSSANESDGAKANGFQIRLPGSSVDSDDVGSECGFTSSTCASWPSSPLPYSMQGRRLSNGSFTNGSVCLTNMSPLPLNAIPPPMPPFLPGWPVPPPPPNFMPVPLPFHPVTSIAQTPLARVSRLPMPPPISGFPQLNSVPAQQYGTNLQTPPPIHSPAMDSPASGDFSANGVYHKHKAWITDEILEMIAVRDRLYKRMKKHPAPDIVEMYKKVRNMVVGMTRNAKRSYEKQFEEQQLEQQFRSNQCQVNRNLNYFSPLNGLPQHTFVPMAW
ncbi:uncharacterized protein LOC120336785 isoform X1 [Styela clava]